ncbi:MAG: hypothetical protein WAV16_03345 [Candidatus Moraniibacteriota bacterium]
MSSQDIAQASINSFKKKLEDAKAAGIQCGCNCGGSVDFKKELIHWGKTCHPCEKCGLLHNDFGRVISFANCCKGYSRNNHVEYEVGLFNNNIIKGSGENIDPKAFPCQDDTCTGSVDTTWEFHYDFKIYSICKKCGLIHTKTGDRHLFSCLTRGYFRSGKIFFVMLH